MTSILHNVTGSAAPAGGGVRWFGSPDDASRIVILSGHAEAWAARSAGGTFSVKWAPKGRVRYRTEGEDRVLSPRGWMLLNSGQPYEMAFEGPSETFCLFFPDDLVSEAWGGGIPDEFPNPVFRPAFADLMTELRTDLAEGTSRTEDLEARLLLVLGGALAAARAHRGEARRTGAVRPATRRRLLARLEVARALIADGEAANLDQVARAAGLSKFHLVRLFRAVHGVTPMKYAEGLRLDRAAARLAFRKHPIEEIAFEAGYEAPGAFARAFRRRFGLSPTAFRAARN